MTLAGALDIALSAYHEDEAECEAILETLAPILLSSGRLLDAAIVAAWRAGRADRIRQALTTYQVQRADLDAEIAADASEP